MKSLLLFIVSLFFFFGHAMAQNSTKETIKVWGSCGMCKKTIEKAAKKAGAQTASWDADKQTLSMSYDNSKTSSLKIQEAIAKTGYDTQDVFGDDEAYNNLHGCCQYDRKAKNADAEKKQ